MSAGARKRDGVFPGSSPGQAVESGGAYTTARGVTIPIVDRTGPFDSVSAAADWIAARHPDAEAVERGDFRIVHNFPVI